MCMCICMHSSYLHLTRVGSIDVEKLFSFIIQRWHSQTNIQNIFTCFNRSVNLHTCTQCTLHTIARFNVILKEIERDDMWTNENNFDSCWSMWTQYKNAGKQGDRNKSVRFSQIYIFFRCVRVCWYCDNEPWLLPSIQTGFKRELIA